jgi:hypothetical protein
MMLNAPLLSVSILAATSLSTAGLTDYPGFINPKATVEAVVDRGPIQEMIIKCPQGTAIIAYSKVEKLFCGPTGGCSPQLSSIVQRACR